MNLSAHARTDVAAGVSPAPKALSGGRRRNNSTPVRLLASRAASKPKIFHLNHCQILCAGVKVDQSATAMNQLAQHLEQMPEASVLQCSEAGPPLLILHIDDDARDHALFKTASRDANVPISWQHITSAQGAISYLQRLLKTNSPASWPNLILLDIAMPRESGLKVLEYTCAKPEFKKLPIVVFSGSKDPKITARAGLLGAKSVIAKPSNFEEAVQLIGSVYQLFSLSVQRGRDRQI
jgi:CheY-like chemotaxis protein